MNTRNLENFGYRELKEAGLLLSTYKTCRDLSTLGNGVAVEFNTNSGNVFLVDEDCNVAMMNGDDLENWHYCPECGHEGFDEDFTPDCNACCLEYIEEKRR